MCIVIHKPAGKTLSHRMLRRAYRANPHSWGICAKDQNGNITVSKGNGGVGDFVKAFAAVEHQEVLIHCRIATSGDKDLLNCHPFEVTDGVWMMHNGVLMESKVPIRDKTKCDSWHFATDILAPVIDNNPLFLAYPEKLGFIKDLEDYVGTSKIAIMSKNHPTIIANRALGEEKEGVWYSNASAFRGSPEHKKRTARFSNKSGYSASYWNGYEWSDDCGGYWSGYRYNNGSSSYGNHTGGSAQHSSSSGTSPTGYNGAQPGHGTVTSLDSKRDVHPTSEVGGRSEPQRDQSVQQEDRRQPNPSANHGAHKDGGEPQPRYVSSCGPHSDAFAIAYIEVTEALEEADKCGDAEMAEDLRQAAAMEYAETLSTFSIDGLKEMIETYQMTEGLAEVVYYALRGELEVFESDVDRELEASPDTGDDDPYERGLIAINRHDRLISILRQECENAYGEALPKVTK